MPDLDFKLHHGNSWWVLLKDRDSAAQYSQSLCATGQPVPTGEATGIPGMFVLTGQRLQAAGFC